MTDVRAFTQSGVDEFRSYLTQLKVDPKLDLPSHLLQSPTATVLIDGEAKVEERSFSTKLQFAWYISEALAGVPDRVLRTSAGLWAWLTLFYFDQVCPRDGTGRRRALRLEKYIPSAEHIATGLDKHLLFFPWKMVSLHGEDAAWLLGGELREDTKAVRELANSYRRNVSHSFVRLARLLYFDAEQRRIRKGATTFRPGSLRRLDRVVGQLDLTYDVFGIDAPALAGLLPQREFGRWLPS